MYFYSTMFSTTFGCDVNTYFSISFLDWHLWCGCIVDLTLLGFSLLGHLADPSNTKYINSANLQQLVLNPSKFMLVISFKNVTSMSEISLRKHYFCSCLHKLLHTVELTDYQVGRHFMLGQPDWTQCSLKLAKSWSVLVVTCIRWVGSMQLCTVACWSINVTLFISIIDLCLKFFLNAIL